MPTADRPTFVLAAKLDADDKTDLAVAIGGFTSNVMVVRGRGDGTFEEPQTFGSLGFPVALAAGTFDGDPFADLGVVDLEADSVLLYHGQGDGSFVEGGSFSTGKRPEAVVAADLDGDGRLDLATVNSGSDDVSVLLGNGDGTFQPARTFAVARDPNSIDAGDLDGDGIIDLAVVSVRGSISPGAISLLRGVGGGKFVSAGEIRTGVSSASVVAVDFDRDGALDLINANGNVRSSDVSLFLGNGDGTFQSVRRYVAGRGPAACAAADLDGDRFLDLAVANGDDSVSILLGEPAAEFEAVPRFEVGGAPNCLVTGDFNGDGTPDLATAFAGVRVLLGNGEGTFQSSALT